MKKITAISCIFALGFALPLTGCDDSGMTPAEHFDDTHGGKTVTPDGTVVKGSPQDTEDGKVEYETTSGRRYETEVDGNGSPTSGHRPID